MNNKEYKYMVCTTCMTFNQVHYIEDTLKGFLMQKVNFPIVYCIIDDASKDGEQDVLLKWAQDNLNSNKEGRLIINNKEYGREIVSISSRNDQALFVIILLNENHYKIRKPKAPYISEWRSNSKYLALCEGDDFWINPQKLQEQVNYLENNPSVGLIRTNINSFIQETGEIKQSFFSCVPFSEIKDTHDDYLINGWFLAPCTWLYRAELENFMPKLDSSRYFTGDLNKALAFTKHAKVYYDPTITAMYRVQESSVSHFKTFRALFDYKQKMKNLRIYYAKQRPIGVRLKCWRVMCKQRIPPMHEWRFFPFWIWICIESFIRLLIPARKGV